LCVDRQWTFSSFSSTSSGSSKSFSQVFRVIVL
jgi:hypothetical protein